MWAEFPADFTIWLVSILAWRYAVISNSYFAGWAGALVDSNATTIGLLPAGVVCLLIPKLLKMLVCCIILGLSLLGWLCSGFRSRLLCLWVMSWGFMVNWLVVKWLVVSDVMVVGQMLWVVSINHMILSVFCLIGFMDCLWVHMMVIVVVGVTVMEGVDLMVAAIEAIDEWVVVCGFVLVSVSMMSGAISIPVLEISMAISMVIIEMIVSMVVIEMFISMVVIEMFCGMSESWSVTMMVLYVVIVLDVWLIESVVVIGHRWTESVVTVSVVLS